jgi:hypothetical protein
LELIARTFGKVVSRPPLLVEILFKMLILCPVLRIAKLDHPLQISSVYSILFLYAFFQDFLLQAFIWSPVEVKFDGAHARSWRSWVKALVLKLKVK